jgi:hypothetical protein
LYCPHRQAGRAGYLDCRNAPTASAVIRPLNDRNANSFICECQARMRLKMRNPYSLPANK